MVLDELLQTSSSMNERNPICFETVRTSFFSLLDVPANSSLHALLESRISLSEVEELKKLIYIDA